MAALVLVFVSMVTVGVLGFPAQWHHEPQQALYREAADSLPVLRALAREHVSFLRVRTGAGPTRTT